MSRQVDKANVAELLLGTNTFVQLIPKFHCSNSTSEEDGIKHEQECHRQGTQDSEHP